MSETTSRDIINIDDSVHEIYKTLTEGNDPIASPFRTMKDIFMWAACQGFRSGERRPMSGKRTMVFRWAQFSPQVDVPLLKAIAVASNGEIKTLIDQNRILTIVEEYANAGIHQLQASMLREQGQPLWNLVNDIRLNLK